MIPEDLEALIRKIEEPDASFGRRAEQRLADLTKPLHSLGLLERTIVRLASIQRTVIPRVGTPAAAVFAADHGVSDEAVSRFGAQVSEEMAVNIAMGTAVSSVLARANAMPMTIVDVGIRSDVRHPAVVVSKVRRGTGNIAQGPAMTHGELLAAVGVGVRTVQKMIAQGADSVVLGELGIANTTAAAAMAAVLLDMDPQQLTGLGTGLDASGRSRKIEVVRRALRMNAPDPGDYWDILQKVGGLEIAALTGGMIAALAARIPVVLDGLMTAVAAYGVASLNGAASLCFVASHRSSEPAHGLLLEAMKLEPLLQWDMRLGEASGALLTVPLLRQGCAIMAQTATFDDARVDNAFSEAQTDMTPVDTPVHEAFSTQEKEAVYRVIGERRDIRVFLPDPIPEEVLHNILWAGHHAPSVGFMQPWNFIVVQDPAIKDRVGSVVERERLRASEKYYGLRQQHYLRLKVEGIAAAPILICVTNDPQRGGPAVLGRNTIPETDIMSTACAIENMWLAARAEGIGMGWVSIYQKTDIREALAIPDGVEPAALLSLGYTPYFPEVPLLERVQWAQRIPIDDLVYYDKWGGSHLDNRE